MFQKLLSNLTSPYLLVSMLLLCLSSTLQAQASALQPDEDSKWRPLGEMQQIVQLELDDTNAALVQPNLTDWSLAMLEAYRSFLQQTQNGLSTKNMSDVLENAYQWIKTEPVSNQAARNMVLDDMRAKQTELRSKLTFN